jgi:hypothetical protein
VTIVIDNTEPAAIASQLFSQLSPEVFREVTGQMCDLLAQSVKSDAATAARLH